MKGDSTSFSDAISHGYSWISKSDKKVDRWSCFFVWSQIFFNDADIKGDSTSFSDPMCQFHGSRNPIKKWIDGHLLSSDLRSCSKTRISRRIRYLLANHMPYLWIPKSDDRKKVDRWSCFFVWSQILFRHADIKVDSTSFSDPIYHGYSWIPKSAKKLDRWPCFFVWSSQILFKNADIKGDSTSFSDSISHGYSWISKSDNKVDRWSSFFVWSQILLKNADSFIPHTNSRSTQLTQSPRMVNVSHLEILMSSSRWPGGLG